ncbi:Uncharacterised protein [uncultured archaeon]|nr:Uncharacterised protein [uncultured archaeon]
MDLNIKQISIKKIDAYRELSLPIKFSKEVKVSVSLNIGLIEIKKIEDGDILLKTNFTLDILDFGHIGAQLETIASTNNSDQLISEWEKSEEKRSLPSDIKGQFDNAIFFYIMPLVISLAEKLTLPIPIPGITTPSKPVVSSKK